MSQPPVANPFPLFGMSSLLSSQLMPVMMRSFPLQGFPYMPTMPKLADSATSSMPPEALFASLTNLVNGRVSPETVNSTLRERDRLKGPGSEHHQILEHGPTSKRIKVETDEDGEGGPSPHSTSTHSPSQESTPQPSPARKTARPIPLESKDDAYFERRRKNNDAAKRSRDLRRRKEEAVAARAATLEQDNRQLRQQISQLKTEMTNLQLVLFGQGPTASAQP